MTLNIVKTWNKKKIVDRRIQMIGIAENTSELHKSTVKLLLENSCLSGPFIFQGIKQKWKKLGKTKGYEIGVTISA